MASRVTHKQAFHHRVVRLFPRADVSLIMLAYREAEKAVREWEAERGDAASLAKGTGQKGRCKLLQKRV